MPGRGYDISNFLSTNRTVLRTWKNSMGEYFKRQLTDRKKKIHLTQIIADWKNADGRRISISNFPFLFNSQLSIVNYQLASRQRGVMIFLSDCWLVLGMNMWCSAFQAGSRCWSTPQNEFCGYENSAFQAKKYPRRQKSIVVETFNSPPHLCLKGNNFHNRRSPTCGQWRHYPPCLKGRTIDDEWSNIWTVKKQTRLNS